MSQGLTPRQEIVEVRVSNAVSESPKAAIERALAQKAEHRIVDVTMTSAEEFNTAVLILLVIEYL